MRSFRDYGGVSKRTHLGWRAGDVHHTDLNEDFSHLKILQHLPLENTPEHKPSEREMGRMLFHHDQLKRDNLGGTIIRYKDMSHDINGALRHGFHHESGTLQLNPWHYWDKNEISPPNSGAGGEMDDESHRLNHDAMHKRASNLDKVASFKTEEPMTLYRGIYHDSGIHKLPHGATFVDHGYTGTSFKKGVAHEFADEYVHDGSFNPGSFPGHLMGHSTIARIHAPAGTMGHYLDVKGDNVHRHEHEFLLHRGTHFQVTGHSRQFDPTLGGSRGAHFHVVHLRVLGQQPKEIKYHHAPELYHGYEGNQPE